MLIDKNTIQPERAIAQEVMKQEIIYCFKDSNTFHLYNSGYFHTGEVAKSEIRQVINNVAKTTEIHDTSYKKPKSAPYKITPSKRTTIFEILAAERYCERTDFDQAWPIIFCENGMYHFDLKGFHKYELYNHEPYKIFHKLPVKYDPLAECLEIDRFLSDLVGFERVPLIYEMLAYFLMPHIRYQKAFIFFGPPSSGKTTFIDMIVKFLGGDNWHNIIANVPLQDLGKRFQLAELRNKWLLFFDDLDESILSKNSQSKFRIVVTNRFIRAQIKNVQDHAKWNNRIKILNTCNNLPELKSDPGEQFWRRWIIIDLFSEFKDKDQMSFEDVQDPHIHEKDPEMLDKITTDEEFSGLLNKIIQAWERLETRKHFPKEWNDIDYVKGIWMININPVKLFVDECCELGPKYEVDYKVFQEELNKFRVEHRANPITPNMMTRSMKMLNIAGFNDNKKIDKKYHLESCGRNYVGVRLKLDAREVELSHLDKIIGEAKAVVHGYDNEEGYKRKDAGEWLNEF